MNLDLRDFLRVHSCAFNGRDLETMASHAAPDCACFRDGEWVGEGPDGLRRLLADEFRRTDIIARVDEVAGQPVIVEFSPDGSQRHGLVHIQGDPWEGRIQEMRIEHRAPLVKAGVPEPDV